MVWQTSWSKHCTQQTNVLSSTEGGLVWWVNVRIPWVFLLPCLLPFYQEPIFPSSKEHVCTDVKSFVSLETYVVMCLFFILLLSFFFPQLLWKLFLSVFQVTHMWCCLIQRFCPWNFDLHSVSMPKVCVPPPGLSSWPAISSMCYCGKLTKTIQEVPTE